MVNYHKLITDIEDAVTRDESPAVKASLLDQAVETIQLLRAKTGTRPTETVRDALTFIQDVSSLIRAGEKNPSAVRAALLDATAMIRDLSKRSHHNV